jgi:SprT-like family
MATRERVEQVGRDLAAQHGLADWKIAVQGHNTNPCLGRCDFENEKLSIEIYAADLMSEDEVKRIWLHEIAHALVGSNHDHDAVWRAQCRELGGIESPAHTPEQLDTVFLNSRKMLAEILSLNSEEFSEVRNVYSSIATARNAIAADHALKLVLAGYKALTQGEPTVVVADSLNLSNGSIAAVKAWNTMWRTSLARRKAIAEEGCNE